MLEAGSPPDTVERFIASARQYVSAMPGPTCWADRQTYPAIGFAVLDPDAGSMPMKHSTLLAPTAIC